MKKRQIKINFIDYLYYTIGGGVWGVKFILIPFLWVFSLIFVMISPLHIGWGIFLAVVGGLLCYGFSYIYDKRGPAVRQYFDKTKYSKEGWKWLTFVVWFVVWGLIPLVLLKVYKGW